MNVIVFGATGSVGRQFVSQALERGERVTAFLRDPASLDIAHQNLRVRTGDVLDRRDVEGAMRGQDAAVVALGSGRKGGVRASGTDNVVRAMKAQGVRRLVCLSTLGAGDSRPALNFFWKRIMFGLLLRDAVADHEAQEVVVRQSDLDWVIVRPGAFTDGGLTKRFSGGPASLSGRVRFKVSRADVADFMLRQLSENTYLRQAAALSY